MTLVRMFFVFLIMVVSPTIIGKEAQVIRRSLAFPTTREEVIAPLELVVTENEPTKKEAKLLFMINLVVNSGIVDIVGVDLEFTDGFLSGAIFNVIKGNPENNRVRFFGATKRYPLGFLDTPTRLERWQKLEKEYKLTELVVESPSSSTDDVVTLVFYLEPSPTDGLLPEQYITMARESIDTSVQK